MDFEKISYAVADHVATIAMDWYANLNAIDVAMADELIAAVAAAGADDEVRVVVIKGAKPKAFSAGGDIGYFYRLIGEDGDVNLDDLIAKIGILADGIKRLPKPVITSVGGAAAGAGMSLALAADFVVCADDAAFIPAFINLGLVPDTGLTYLLTRSIGAARTLQYTMTGKPIKAEEALAWGLATQVVEPEQLEEATAKLAGKLVAGPTKAYAALKQQVYAAAFADYRTWLDEVEASTQAECGRTKDFQEGCKAFIEKRKPVFTGE